VTRPISTLADLRNGPAVYDVTGAATFLACSPGSVRELVASGALRGVRIGRLIKIPASAIREFLGEPDFDGAA
jgi:excisionase family DNA binding protein